MKIIIGAIAAITAMSSFASSAIADVSINIRFGSSPSYNSAYRNYNPYRTNVYQNGYPRHQNQYDRYNRNVRPSVIVRQVNPYYGDSWNHTVTPNYFYNVNLGDRYIIEKRLIRVR